MAPLAEAETLRPILRDWAEREEEAVEATDFWEWAGRRGREGCLVVLVLGSTEEEGIGRDGRSAGEVGVMGEIVWFSLLLKGSCVSPR